MKKKRTKMLVLKITQKRGQKPDYGTVFSTMFWKLNIALLRVINTPTKYTALCHTKNDVDQLISKKATSTLKTVYLQPKIPPQVIAHRSVICRQKICGLAQRHPKKLR